MHLEQVVRQLRSMRLSTMADSLTERLNNGDTRNLTPEEFLALLVEDEYSARRNRKLQRMIARTGFKPEGACLENIRYEARPGLKRSDIAPFSTAGWIDNAVNVILTGPTGCGKTYLAEALGLAACKMGHPARKIRFQRLFEELSAAKGTGMLLGYLEKLAKVKVLILDDFLMTSVTQQELGYLADILEERDGSSSLIVTTQYPPNTWHDRLPDPTIADAICDRLVHRAIKINLKGESMRKKETPSHESDRKESETKKS